MDTSINLDFFEKKIDSDTGSILFYRNDIKGIPDKVFNGVGYTIEFKNKEIMLIDIYNSSKLINILLNKYSEIEGLKN